MFIEKACSKMSANSAISGSLWIKVQSVLVPFRVQCSVKMGSTAQDDMKSCSAIKRFSDLLQKEKIFRILGTIYRG